MKLVRDAETAEWIGRLLGASEEFDWDDGNRQKNRKHGVQSGDVEALFRGPSVFAGRIVEPSHDEPLWLLLGQDGKGRRLALVFTRRMDRLRPISCRPMRKDERGLYEKKLAKERKTRARKVVDAQVKEFERRDLGKDIAASGSAMLIRPNAYPTSIALDKDLVTKLREKGAKRGLGYQTMLKVIVHEHIDEY